MTNDTYRFIWGPISDNIIQMKWNQLVYFYSPQYHTACIQKTRHQDNLYILLLLHNEQAISGGVFTKKEIKKGPFRLTYLEFGVPMAIQCSFITNPQFKFGLGREYYSLMENAFKELSEGLSAQFILCKGVKKTSEFSLFAKDSAIYIESAPFWSWYHEGSFEAYIEKLNKKKRKKYNRLMRKCQELNFTVEGLDIEEIDEENLGKIVNLFKLNCAKYGYDTDWDSLGYFQTLQTVADKRVKILQIKNADEPLAFELIVVTADRPVECEVSLTGSKELNIASFSLYDTLAIGEIQWIVSNIAAFVKCSIGQGCDQSKSSLGAREESALSVIWPRLKLFRYLGNKMSSIIECLPNNIKTKLKALYR